MQTWAISTSQYCVRNATAKHLVELKQLRELSLGWTKITDPGLLPLKKMPQLEKVDLSGLKVAARGIVGLQEALPGAKIIYNW